MIAQLVYFLCAVTSSVCTILLLRAYGRLGFRLLLWSGVCFGALTINNVLLFVDLIIVPEVDLLFWRNVTAVVGIGMLLFGLIWDTQ